MNNSILTLMSAWFHLEDTLDKKLKINDKNTSKFVLERSGNLGRIGAFVLSPLCGVCSGPEFSLDVFP